ncbi:MAG: hypothetical protein H0U13_05040, partial [Gemmatimonadaceae bacterium]|nr:hypothetical protein [Gemmatimonadaceae bacterium]
LSYGRRSRGCLGSSSASLLRSDASLATDIPSSRTVSPTLNIPIGTAYVPPASSAPGCEIEIDIRGKRIAATVQKMPFYKNGTHL